MASSSMISVNLLGKRNSVDDLETRPLRRRKPSEEKDKTKGRVKLLETKSDQANLLISVKEAAVRTKTLLVANLSPETEISVLISDIIDFFKTVAKVVRVQFIVTRSGEHMCCGFVEFASVNDAKKALEKKNGEYLHYHKIFLDVANIAPYHHRQPKYFIDHKVVCYEERLLIEKDDVQTKPSVKKPEMGGFCGKKITFSYNDDGYLQQEILPKEEDDGYLQQEILPKEEDEIPPDFVEVVLFVANLSPQTRIPHIINFFEDVGNVQVRLIVNQENKHVGYGFVEFDSSNEAWMALENKNGEYLHDHKIFLHVAKTAPYPPVPKYNLAEKLCYEDYLRRVILLREEDETMEGLDKTPVFVEAVAVRKKTLYVTPLSCQTKISHIIDFFKDVGGVVHVRLIVNRQGVNAGYGYVEFASPKKAKKALQKKNGEHFQNSKIVLELAETVPLKYCIDHKVWYEDYLRQESLLINEDEAVEGPDETRDFVEEVAKTKRTLFFDIHPCRTRIPDNISDKISEINYFFGHGEVVCVRFSVNSRGEHVGSGFVEFASAYSALMALERKNDNRNRTFFLDVVKTAPYPLRPKYKLAEKLWYEDYLRQFGKDYLETLASLKKCMMKEFCGKKITFCGKKITFPDSDPESD